MSMKSLFLSAALGLAGLSLSGCVYDGGPYSYEGPGPYYGGGYYAGGRNHLRSRRLLSALGTIAVCTAIGITTRLSGVTARRFSALLRSDLSSSSRAATLEVSPAGYSWFPMTVIIRTDLESDDGQNGMTERCGRVLSPVRVRCEHGGDNVVHMQAADDLA